MSELTLEQLIERVAQMSTLEQYNRRLEAENKRLQSALSQQESDIENNTAGWNSITVMGRFERIEYVGATFKQGDMTFTLTNVLDYADFVKSLNEGDLILVVGTFSYEHGYEGEYNLNIDADRIKVIQRVKGEGGTDA